MRPITTLLLLSVGWASCPPSATASHPVPPGAIYLRNEDTVLMIDPATGDRTVISSDTVGSGPTMNNIPGLGPFSREQSAIIVENKESLMITNVGSILRVDRRTGDRSLVHSHHVRLRDIALENQDHLVYLNEMSDIVRVSLLGGGTVVVSSSSVGTGEYPFTPCGIEMATDGGILMHTLSGQNIIRVDPVTSERTVLSGYTNGWLPIVGTGPHLYHWNMAVDPNNGRIYSTRKGADLYATHPVSGDRSVLSSSGIVGSGPAFLRLEGLGVAADGTIYVLDRGQEVLFSVDPQTGDRNVVSSFALDVGTGPVLCSPEPHSTDTTFFLTVALDAGDIPSTGATFWVE